MAMNTDFRGTDNLKTAIWQTIGQAMTAFSGTEDNGLSDGYMPSGYFLVVQNRRPSGRPISSMSLSRAAVRGVFKMPAKIDTFISTIINVFPTTRGSASSAAAGAGILL